MKILEILEGSTESENLKFTEFLNHLDSEKQKILWYPSSGIDFSDIVYFSPNVNNVIDTNDLPNLFIHNDYDSRSFENIIYRHNSTIFDDNKTIVSINDKISLRFNLKAKGNYNVRERFVDFYSDRLTIPHIYLLKINIITTQHGIIDANLLYFSFENINFFEFLISNSIKIDFMVKVREGCGLGGSRMSVTQVYFLLSRIDLKYLINDTEIHWNEEVIEDLIGMSVKIPKPYTLNHLDSIENWSGFNVLINKLTYAHPIDINHTIETIRTNFNPKLYFGIE